MSVKKAFDQTIRDIKREVNKKVLKVPSIERKVLDATSNEPWGPHGSLLADIALASRNFHEYQMIMAIIWKRINDTGKNWRHVYKALTVLEYLVAHGSDRVIDDIREHAYQISTLSDFQYLDSSGRDQGNNVRRKSQTLVMLVNDKERIQEVRQKAASNRDKFRNSSAMGGMYRPGSGTYGDDRYESRYEDRNGYGREREWGYRDDESYNRYGDSYSREGDRSGRDSEERYGGESYTADYQYGSRNRSSDRDADHAYDADDHHSSRGSSVKADDHSQDGRQLERKFSEQNLPAPPSYEEAVDDSRSPTFNERDGEMPAASAPISSSPTAAVDPTSQTNAGQGASSQPILENDTFDEFDPRGFVSAAPATSNNTEMDLLGSLSDSFSPNPLAIMPASSGTEPSEVGTAPTNHETSFMGVTSVNATMNQSFEDPFGDTPFKVSPSTDEHPAQPQHFDATASFEPPMNNIEQSQPAASKLDTLGSLDFGDTFPSIALDSSNVPNVQASPNAPSVQAPPLNPQFMPQEPPPGSDVDILAGILPPTGPPSSQEAFAQPVGPPHGGSMAQSVPTTTISAYNPMFIGQSSAPPPVHHRRPTNPFPLSVSAPTSDSNLAHHVRTGSAGLPDGNFLGNLLPQVGSTVPSSSQPPASTSAGSSSLVPQQLRSDKFETKSAVWADTLSRGLVNLNISGSKINPLADIGIDFEALNRKEKRMEKPSMAPTTSNLTMGKAMGSGSGVSRSGAGSLMRPSNPLMGSGMGMGMNMGIGMGSYGAPNQPMGMGMNMGMGQGAQMQHPHGLPPGSNPSVYNPMMGTRGYAPQQPYGGGYR